MIQYQHITDKASTTAYKHDRNLYTDIVSVILLLCCGYKQAGYVAHKIISNLKHTRKFQMQTQEFEYNSIILHGNMYSILKNQMYVYRDNIYYTIISQLNLILTVN